MAKLVKAHRFELEDALAHLERGIAFIKRDDIAVCTRYNRPPTVTTDYVSYDGRSSLSPSAKDIGSDLAGLYFALDNIKAILADDKQSRQRR